MNKKIKIGLFVLIILGTITLCLTYKSNNKIIKTKKRKQNNLAIMIKEDGATDYIKSNSKDIPKGDYTLNYEKSYCKNNGKIGNYDSSLGKVSFSFIGTDSCFLYFDYKKETIKLGSAVLEVNSEAPDFSKVATTNEGLFKAQDDLGTSYYFRGAVDNNWVKFGKDRSGKDIYWRIIRINGDGSIRMIYTGTTAPTESTKVVMTGLETQVTSSVFNGSSEAFTYITYNSSSVKSTLENWYKTTTLETDSATKALVSQDQIFCSDKSATTSSSEIPKETNLEYNNQYYFGAYIRLEAKKSPVLTCLLENNKFTSKNSSIGNKTLDYPVGLITADEVAMAGGVYGSNNSSYYLYTGQKYWSGSPKFASQSASGGWPTSFNASIYEVNSTGQVSDFMINQGVSYSSNVRPVISLSSKAKLTGNGTWNNVYEVEKKGYETILANNTVHETTPDFTKVATTNEGLFKAQDDLGTSYYFRGAVDNNWVKFGKDSSGKDIYWRIIRINGDGSIRMIYTGTTAPTESTKVVMTGTGTQISTSKFNSNYDKAEYVGYMYTSGQQHGTSTDSTIKQAIDNWYAGTTLKDNPLVSKDQIFCNDRSPSSTQTAAWTSTGNYYYGAYGRLQSNKTPILTCPTTSDKFTSKKSSIGNKALEYPVGLITEDEVAMAGGVWGTGNSSYYLYTNQFYWAGSPYGFDAGGSVGFLVFSDGTLRYVYVREAYGARPVVSLSSEVKLSGSGTYNDVYTVSSD